jgi:DNA-binding GntR family transcriptional regulator
MEHTSGGARKDGLDDPLGSRSLALAIRREMDKLILGGSLLPGERLSEIQFAERFKVSRGPVREAFRGLVEAGLLEFIPNRGVFVRRVSLADAIECYEVRSGLFGLAGRLAAERIEDTAIAPLRDLVDGMDAAIAAGDGPRYYALNLELHDGVLSAAGNSRLVATYRRLVRELHLVRALNLENAEHMRASNAEHRDMVEALTARDPDRAFATHFRHVMNAKDRVIELSASSEHAFQSDDQAGSDQSRKNQGRKTE